MSRDNGVTSEQAFAALGSELRIKILHVLTNATEAGEPQLSFSEIYDRIEIDSTSQLSYHLNALEGIFVRNSESGYMLTQAGDRIIRAVRSGTYSDQPTFEPTTIEGQCPYCDTMILSAEYRDSSLAVECRSCSERIVTFDLPPAASQGRTNVEMLHSCNHRAHQEYATALRGTCSTCGGSTDLEIKPSNQSDVYICVAKCRQCGLLLFAPLEARLLHHPAVISFYWRYGIDASTLPFWDLPSYVKQWEIEAVETDPLEFKITIVHEGESLQVRVDDELHVFVLDDHSPVSKG